MPPIRLLHASDLHIAVEQGRRSLLDKDFKTFRGVVEALWDITACASSYELNVLRQLTVFIYNALQNENLNGIILTGDLATTGEQDDIDMVDLFFNEEADEHSPWRGIETAGPTLQFIDDPETLAFQAGNHDRFEYDFRLVRLIGPLFGPRFFNISGKNFYDLKFRGKHADISPPFSVGGRMSNGKRLVVFVLPVDLTLNRIGDHKGAYGWIAQGKASKDEGKAIARLKLHTQAINDNCFGEYRIVWACHFPPHFVGETPRTRLLDPNDLIKAANEMGVTAILTGHTHYQTSYSRPGMAGGVLCCGTTTQFEPDSLPGRKDAMDVTRGNHFQILEFDCDRHGNVFLTVEHYKYIPTELDKFFNVLEGPGENMTNWKLVSKAQPLVI